MSAAHDCVSRINDLLKPHNTQLSLAIDFSGKNRELIQVTTSKADPDVRGKPMVMFASHCPFCGIKLEGV